MPSQQPELIERRVISNRGVFIITPDPIWRHFWLYTSIIRLPRTDYGSSQYNPDRSFYATYVWSRKNYILREDVQRYEQHCFTWSPDPTAYIAQAETCLHSRTIDYFEVLGSLLGVTVPPPSEESRIYFEPLDEYFDRIRVVCRGETAIVAELWGQKKDVDCPEAAPTPKPPPDPDLPPPTFPPDTPLELTDYPASPPYFDDDFGDTDPLPGDIGDEPPPPVPEGEECSLYAFVTTFTENGDPPVTNPNNFTVYGRYGASLRVIAGEASALVQVYAQGVVGVNECDLLTWYTVASVDNTVENVTAEIISITPV